jgi:hypothetical protein
MARIKILREISYGKHSDTRIKPLPLAFGQRPRPLHSRYTRTETCVHWVMAVAVPTYNRYKLITVSIMKRTETAMRRFQN